MEKSIKSESFMKDRCKEKNNAGLNFTIDHILNRAGQKSCTTYCADEAKNNDELNSPNQYHIQEQGGLQYTFQWLNCTRYHPPKLLRCQKKEGVKRQPGRHPRIPFTAIQIETLESSYRKCPYLNTEEVNTLSKLLDLSDCRIKIWFQNRRAREKREKHSSSNQTIDCNTQVFNCI